MSRCPDPVVTPIVHLNGDRPEVLMAHLWDAVDAVCAAMAALAGCAPNGRNYYPVDGLLTKATEQHWARMAALQDVERSLRAECAAIDKEMSHA